MTELDPWSKPGQWDALLTALGSAAPLVAEISMGPELFAYLLVAYPVEAEHPGRADLHGIPVTEDDRLPAGVITVHAYDGRVRAGVITDFLLCPPVAQGPPGSIPIVIPDP